MPPRAKKCFQNWSLFSPPELSWAELENVDMRGAYRHFPAQPDRVTRRYRVSCQIIKRCKPDDPVTLKARLCDLFFNVYFSIVKMRAEGGKLMSWRHTNIDQKCRRCTHPSPNIWNCKHSRNALCKDNNKTKKKKADRRLKSIWLKKKSDPRNFQ